MRVYPKDPRERGHIIDDRWRLRGGIIVAVVAMILLFLALLL